MTAIVTVMTRKGQVTVPAPIRRALGPKKGDRVAFMLADNQVRLVPLGSVTAHTAGALRGYSQEPVLTAEELREAAEQAIAEDVMECLGG